MNIETERVLGTDGGLAATEMPLTLYLVKRLELNAKLNTLDPSTLYGAGNGGEGYTDYPTLDEAA